LSSAFQVPSYFVILALVWIAGTTAHIYPQFKNAIRVDGKLTSVADYIDEVCGQRVGPAAAACLAETGKHARVLLRREQGKSILLIDAPLLGYLLVYLPLCLAYSALNRRQGAVLPPKAELSGVAVGDVG